MNRLKWAVLLLAVTVSWTSAAQTPLSAKLDTKPVLTLAVAKELAAAAEAEAKRNNWNVSIAIVDDAGRLLYFQRMDGAGNSSVDVAMAKARHAANYRRPTLFHQELLEKGNNVVLALPDSMPIEGGLQLMTAGKTIGGIGVSGVRSSEDGQIAKAAADLLGK
jgi:glc operon protein GlcG